MKEKWFLLLLCMVLLSGVVSASLGISPAIINADFKPGGEYVFNFNIISDSPDEELEISLGGDLAQYASLSKESSIGATSFQVFLNLPQELEEPGRHSLGVRIREVTPEDRFLGTAIDISGFVKIFIPYPGIYAETSLIIDDGNVGDEIPVEIHVINRGIEDFKKLDVKVDFKDESGEIIGTMDFKNVSLASGGDRYFRKTLDTEDYRPGNYIAEALITYDGGASIEEDSFRIGSLFVDILNFTQALPIGGIRKYHVGIESRWNNLLGEVFADVDVFNDIQKISFRTPSVDLRGWEKKTLEGFLDTKDMEEGFYEVNITLSYEDQTTSKSGSLLIEKTSYLLWIAVAAVTFVAIILILTILYWKRNKKGKKKK